MKALFLCALLALPAAASRPLTPPAPEFPPGAAWINAKPLSLAMMRGRKTVLVVFLNPTGLHSIRALSALKAWFDRYALSQLMIVGVVTPDLEIQKDAVWVRAEVKRLGIDFPVVIDGDRRLWKSYANDGWPAFYVIDRKGRITFDHLGEGDYSETEREVREALADLVELPDAVSPPEPRTKDCGHATPDVPMGSRASAVQAKAIDNDFSTRRMMLVESRERELTTRGKWDLEPDGLRLVRPAADLGDFVRVVFEATQALAVLGPPATGKKTRFFIKLDDQWLYDGVAGKDVRFDDDGRSFVEVSSPRLYDLIRDNGDKPHELYVEPDHSGGGVYGFQFADACVATKLP